MYREPWPMIQHCLCPLQYLSTLEELAYNRKHAEPVNQLWEGQMMRVWTRKNDPRRRYKFEIPRGQFLQKLDCIHDIIKILDE